MSDSLDILADLIAFDTVSANSNRAMIEHCADLLDASGIAAEVIPSASGDKASLWATIGPTIDGGVVLSGHSDVVPVTGQSWSSDPFGLDIRDGRAFGRGTCDMKGFIACVLAAAPRFASLPLKRPVHIALTFDEEIGCIGAPELIDFILDHAPRPALAIVGEPTSMRVVNAHKGICVARTTIRGIEAHSSLSHLGVSAVGLAGEAVALLQRIARELEDVTDDRFEPPHTTVSVNRIGGGTALNILAGESWFDWDVRTIPGATAREIVAGFEARLEAELIAPVRARHAGVGAQTSVIADTPPLGPEEGGAAETLATRLLGDNRAVAVAYGAEAGLYQRAGLSAVIVGPGSIEQAHKADEYVALEQLDRCDRFLTALGDALAAG